MTTFKHNSTRNDRMRFEFGPLALACRPYAKMTLSHLGPEVHGTGNR